MSQTESAEFARLYSETVRFSEVTQRAFLAALHNAVVSNGGTWPASAAEDTWNVIKMFDDARAGEVDSLMRRVLDAESCRVSPIYIGGSPT